MPDRAMHSLLHVGRWALTLASAVVALGVTSGEAAAQRRVAPDSLRNIQHVSPLYGPVGTEVTVFTENLPLQAKVHVGVGATRTGFEALFEAEQQMWGEISATVMIPETAPWDRAVVLIAFDAIFAPIGISEPFHVINSEGLLQRTGEITGEGVECLAMRDTDGFLYTLTGEIGSLQEGDRVSLKGTYVETSTCMQGTTINVVRILPPSSQ